MACPVPCQRRPASTIMSGMAIPMTANTMWKARDTPICERAARRSDMKGKISGEVREVRGGWWRFVSCITFLLTTDTRGDLRPIAATLNKSLKRQDDHHPPRPLE